MACMNIQSWRRKRSPLPLIPPVECLPLMKSVKDELDWVRSYLSGWGTHWLVCGHGGCSQGTAEWEFVWISQSSMKMSAENVTASTLSKLLDELPPRVQRFKMRLMRFKIRNYPSSWKRPSHCTHPFSNFWLWNSQPMSCLKRKQMCMSSVSCRAFQQQVEDWNRSESAKNRMKSGSVLQVWMAIGVHSQEP